MEARISPYPASVQPGIPKLGHLKPGCNRMQIGELFEKIRRPVPMDDNKRYRLVTVKRSRGGVVSRGELYGHEIAVKSQFEVREGDFLISKRQIVHGACGVVPKHLDGSIVSNEYAVLRCRPNVLMDFVKHLSFTPYFQQTCFHSSIGVHVEKMIFKLEKWFEWKIDIPKFEEQQHIAAFLSAIDKRLEQLRKKRDLLETYKRGVMQKIFSQEIRFKADDGSDFDRKWKSTTAGAYLSQRNTKGNNELELYAVTMKRGLVPRKD